jgi:hypothetical protein
MPKLETWKIRTHTLGRHNASQYLFTFLLSQFELMKTSDTIRCAHLNIGRTTMKWTHCLIWRDDSCQVDKKLPDLNVKMLRRHRG